MKRKIPMLMVLLVLNGGRILAEQSGGGSVRADCYVAVNGNDAWSGKLPEPNADKTDGPFVSLERARNAVREIKRDTPSQNITVLIREGTYCLDRTLSFGLADSAAAGCLITYAAHPGEKPVFSSDMGIGPWKKIPAGAAKRLPASAQGQVWMADLPVGLERFCTLYEGETRLPRARSAGTMPRNGKEASRTRLLFPGGFLRDWTNLDDVEIVVRPKVQFTMNILGLRSVDEKEGVATTACMASYPLTSPEEKAWALYAKTPRTLWVENVLEVLDQPGEWVADTHARKIYLWPTSNEPGGHIVAPRLRELIRVEGGIDFDGAQDSPVRGLVFRGLTFTRGDRDVWTDDDAGLQHDWALYDKGDALLRFRGAEECMVEDCRFMNSGGTAVRLDLHCRENRVSGNEIEHMGGSGILLAGYGPGTKDVSQSNLISNNHIQHSGEIFWHAPGIMVWQSGGNRIANNLIHDLPGMGIVVSGVRPVSFGKNLRECSRTIRRSEVGEVRGMADAQPFLHARNNLVVDNELHHVVTLMGDSNAIYISGAGEGNTIRRNHIHDCMGPGMHSAIRTDGWQGGTLITENVIHRCLRSGIARKYNNDVVNNIIVDILEDDGNPVPKMAYWGYIDFRSYPGEMQCKGAKVQRNICCHSGKRAKFYNVINARTRPEDCDADSNLFFLAGDHVAGKRFLLEQQAKGIDRNSVCTDPLFVDMKNGDLRLRPESPAFKLGFQAIDMSRIGLLKKSRPFQ